VYGHLDIQLLDKKEGGWNTEPFKLTEIDGKYYGHGLMDDKGPALSWLWAIAFHHQLGKELPIK
jgi:acetylornithine deacetylase/succinyl-diaminopimelate desuccinylase-like protein